MCGCFFVVVRSLFETLANAIFQFEFSTYFLNIFIFLAMINWWNILRKIQLSMIITTCLWIKSYRIPCGWWFLVAMKLPFFQSIQKLLIIYQYWLFVIFSGKILNFSGNFFAFNCYNSGIMRLRFCLSFMKNARVIYFGLRLLFTNNHR